MFIVLTSTEIYEIYGITVISTIHMSIIKITIIVNLTAVKAICVVIKVIAVYIVCPFLLSVVVTVFVFLN